MKKLLHFSIFPIVLIFLPLIVFSQSVELWQTNGSMNKLFEKQNDINFITGTGEKIVKIYLDNTTKYQSVEGFGWTLTQGSAKLINSLGKAERTLLLNNIFNTKTGLGSNVIRIGIGATDLSESAYTYNENINDWELSGFSLEGPDNDYLIPLLKEILLINSNIKILATPWTAPRWMKNKYSYTGGELKPECYEVYAKYFIKYFEAMKSNGIQIWAITPQNEPLHDGNEPSMYMSSEQQYNFIQNHLGPAIGNSQFGHVKILAYDHNCDNPGYAINVCKSEYVNGSAFHLYDTEANIGVLSYVYDQTNKDVYFTEQYTGPGDFNNDFAWHMEKVMLGSINNWSRIALEWNLASDSNFEPHTPGGCNSCLGAITIDGTNITYNTSYYLVAQMSKVTQAGAYRIKSESNDNNLICSSFENPDKTISLVVYNKANKQKSFDVVIDGKSFSYTIDNNSAVSFIWEPDKINELIRNIELTPAISDVFKGNSIQLNATVLPENATDKELIWTTTNQNIAEVDQNGLVKAKNIGAAMITATSVNNINAICFINVKDQTSEYNFPHIYNIISEYNDKGLDVKDRSTESGIHIQQWQIENGGNDNQRWLFESIKNNSFYIKSKLSELYLSVDKNNYVIQNILDGSNSQVWKLISLPDNGLYVLINTDNNKALDIESLSVDNGASVLLQGYDASQKSQIWKLAEIEKSSVKNNKNKTKYLVTNEFIEINNSINKCYALYSLSGNLIKSNYINQTNERIDISGLKKGIYMFRIENEIIKIIKQ